MFLLQQIEVRVGNRGHALVPWARDLSNSIVFGANVEWSALRHPVSHSDLLQSGKRRASPPHSVLNAPTACGAGVEQALNLSLKMGPLGAVLR